MTSILGTGNLDRYQPGSKKRKPLGRVIIMLIAGVLTGFILTKVLFSTFIATDNVMLPECTKGDHMIFFNFGSIRHNDLVLVSPPGQDGTFLVRRVIGLAGDRVVMDKGTYSVTGSMTLQGAFRDSGHSGPGKAFASRDNQEISVGEGSCLVIASDLYHPFDSRLWGPVPLNRVKGVLLFRF